MFTSRLLGLALSVGTLALAGTVSAAPILSVDFGIATSPVESGFQGFDPAGSTTVQSASFESFNANPGSAGQTYGSLTVTETNAQGLFDRGASGGGGVTTGASPDLYRDFIFSNDVNGGDFNIEIDGLNNNTAYTLRLYSFDDNADAGATITTTFTPTIGSGAPGSVTYISKITQQPSTPDQYSTLVTWTSNGSGQLAFDVTATDGFTRLDGLVLSLDTVPEPASLALLGIGGLCLLKRRR